MPRINKQKVKNGICSKLNNDLATPKFILDDLEKEFGQLFDPCPLHGKKLAEENPDKDGLKMEWQSINFINPPFNDIKSWLKKGIEEYKKGKTNIFLITARINTKYWKEYVIPYASEIRFVIGEIQFGEAFKKGLPLPTCVVVFDPKKGSHPSLKLYYHDKNKEKLSYWSF